MRCSSSERLILFGLPASGRLFGRTKLPVGGDDIRRRRLRQIVNHGLQLSASNRRADWLRAQ
jgi:hypothetical protein